MKTVGFLLCVVTGSLSGGCQGDELAPILTTFDPCDSVAIVPPQGVTEAQRRSLVDGLDMWREVLDLRWSVAESADTDVPVVFEEAAGIFFGLYDDTNGVIYLNTTLGEGFELAVTVAHEVGHVFGLHHNEEAESVMQSGNLMDVPSAQDGTEVTSMWGACE